MVDLSARFEERETIDAGEASGGMGLAHFYGTRLGEKGFVDVVANFGREGEKRDHLRVRGMRSGWERWEGSVV